MTARLIKAILLLFFPIDVPLFRTGTGGKSDNRNEDAGFYFLFMHCAVSGCRAERRCIAMPASD